MHISKLDSKILEKASHENSMDMLTKQVLFDWKERKDPITGRLSMFNYAVLAPSGYFNQHVHNGEVGGVGMTEIFFIHKGKAMFKINEKEFELTDNTLVIVDAGEVHSMKNLSDVEPVIYTVFGVSDGGNTKVIKEGY